MNNNARVWTIGTVIFAVVTGLAVNFLYDWMKSAPTGGGDTSRSTSEVPAARLGGPSPSGSFSGGDSVGSGKTAEPTDDKFRDISIVKPYATYLRGNVLLMETSGAKVVRLKNGRRVILGIGSVVLKDTSAKVRIDAEKVCKVKALAAIVGEREGVQVAHEEKVAEKTVIILDEKGEKGKSVSEVLSITRTKTQGIVKGMSVVGKWLSKDGKVLSIAMGSICDSKGEPVEDE